MVVESGLWAVSESVQEWDMAGDGDALAMVPVLSPTAPSTSRDLVGWLGMGIPMGVSNTRDKTAELAERRSR